MSYTLDIINNYANETSAKWNATVNNGFNFEAWVFNNKGELNIINTI